MDKAWTNVCPDEEMPSDYTVGDPVAPKNATVKIEQVANPAKIEGFGK